MTLFRKLLAFVFVSAVAMAAIAKGVQLIRFEAADVAADATMRQLTAKNPADPRLLRSQSIANIANLRAWTPILGVGSKAWENIFSLDGLARLDDGAEADLIELLAQDPTAGSVWFDLAIMRRRRGAPLPEILAALQMSRVIHPREPQTMIDRTRFMLELWEFLPADEQRHALNQLLELKALASPDELQPFKHVLASKPEGIRKALRSALAARGAADAAWLQALGLPP